MAMWFFLGEDKRWVLSSLEIFPSSQSFIVLLLAPEGHILDVNFSVGVTLEINLSPRHIRSGTVLKYVREDGEGRERAEMRPLCGAGS